MRTAAATGEAPSGPLAFPHQYRVIRSGWVNTSNPSSRAMPTRVRPVDSAVRTAKAVGADTPTMIAAPNMPAFCTSSMEIRLDNTMTPSASVDILIYRVRAALAQGERELGLTLPPV